ncbi:MAG: hypothetical protein ACOYCD_01670 [Kiritimatiellia bacterium]|jgi:hypothetical protein
MSTIKPKGATYICPVCGAEIIVLAPCSGCFIPRCCDKPMELRPRRVQFYVCPVCKAEIAALHQTKPDSFHPRCCGQDMRPA